MVLERHGALSLFIVLLVAGCLTQELDVAAGDNGDGHTKFGSIMDEAGSLPGSLRIEELGNNIWVAAENDGFSGAMAVTEEGAGMAFWVQSPPMRETDCSSFELGWTMDGPSLIDAWEVMVWELRESNLHLVSQAFSSYVDRTVYEGSNGIISPARVPAFNDAGLGPVVENWCPAELRSPHLVVIAASAIVPGNFTIHWRWLGDVEDTVDSIAEISTAMRPSSIVSVDFGGFQATYFEEQSSLLFSLYNRYQSRGLAVDFLLPVEEAPLPIGTHTYTLGSDLNDEAGFSFAALLIASLSDTQIGSWNLDGTLAGMPVQESELNLPSEPNLESAQWSTRFTGANSGTGASRLYSSIELTQAPDISFVLQRHLWIGVDLATATGATGLVVDKIKLIPA